MLRFRNDDSRTMKLNLKEILIIMKCINKSINEICHSICCVPPVGYQLLINKTYIN